MSYEQIIDLTKGIMAKFEGAKSFAQSEGEILIRLIKESVNLEELRKAEQKMIFSEGFLSGKDCDISMSKELDGFRFPSYLLRTKNAIAELEKLMRIHEEELISQGETLYGVRIAKDNGMVVGDKAAVLFIRRNGDLKISEINTISIDEINKSGLNVGYYRNGNIAEILIREDEDKESGAIYNLRNNRDNSVSDVKCTIFENGNSEKIELVLDNQASKIVKADYFTLIKESPIYNHVKNITDDKGMLNQLNIAIFGRSLESHILNSTHKLKCRILSRKNHTRDL